MITAKQKKFVKSLIQKKIRKQHQCFVVEGEKLVQELLNSDYSIKDIYATKKWIVNHPNIPVNKVSQKDLSIISSLKTPNEVLAVVNILQPKEMTKNTFVIALDFIQDPGNLGTIIRTADWFNIHQIVCSLDTVDVYNPKVIQASMGSIFRVNVVYAYLPDFFKENADKTVYAAMLDGELLNKTQKISKENSILLLGNESKGVSEKLLPYVHHSVKIHGTGKAESLNVASAAAILCYEFILK